MLNNSANVLLSCNVIIKQQTDEIVVLNLIPVVLMLAPCYSTFISMTLFIYLFTCLFIHLSKKLIDSRPTPIVFNCHDQCSTFS